jgi:multidrug efflux pump subunit AcrB
MKRILEFFASRHILATLITLMILLLGLNSGRTLQRDRFPNVDFGWVTVNTAYPGASPEDVELNVTNKIEDELKSVTGIKEIHSWSIENFSNIWLQIDPDANDPEKVKQNVRDAVARVTDFPDEVTDSPAIYESTSADNSIVGVGIYGDLPYPELRELARQFEKKLKTVPGVSRVERLGYRAREIKIEVSPERMERYQISLREIIGAIQARNIRLSGGTFESFTSEKNVVTLAQFAEPVEVGDVIVRSSFDGPLIKVKDLAVIKDDFEEETMIAGLYGQKAILWGVFKDPDADIIRTVKAVRRLCAEESVRMGGTDLEQRSETIWEKLTKAVVWRDPVDDYSFGPARVALSDDISRSVENSFRIVINNGLLGLAFVLIVLSLFLNWRSAVWVALGIPVSLAGTVFLLPVFDSFLDTVTLSVMVVVIGIIVDDGIIISENITQKRERGMSPHQAATEGVSEVFRPVLTTVLTTIIAFAPMFWMEGEIGKVVYVVPLTIILALGFSLLEALFALPAHLSGGFQRAERRRRTRGPAAERQWFGRVRDLYQRLANRFLRLRYLMVFISLLVLGGAVWYGVTQLDFVLFPSKGAERFYLNVELPTGTTLAVTEAKISEVRDIVATLPEEEMQSYFSRIGSTNWGAPQNTGWIGVSLTPYSRRERSADDIVEDLRTRIDEVEGIERFWFDIDTGGPPVGEPVVLRIIGNDNARRRELTGSIKEYLATVEGVKDIDSNDELGKEQVEIKINYPRLARLGLTVQDVARNVRIAYDGQIVTTLRDGEEDVEFRVQLTEDARRDLDYLRNLPIPNQRGRLIRLREVARLETQPGPLGLRHFDGDRTTTITADVDQDITTPVQVVDQVMAQFDLEKDWPGLSWLTGGEAQETQESVVSLITTFAIAMLGIYFILVLLFNSYTQPFMVMLAIPFAFIGVVLAFMLHSETPSFLSLMGAIGLMGVVVNDSLVLVNHLNELRAESTGTSLREIVAQGTANRLRAILLTTLTTVAGLMPLAYGIGGTDLYMSPMALVMGWGLLFATPLTLMLVPCLYLIGDDISRGLGGLFGRGRQEASQG